MASDSRTISLGRIAGVQVDIDLSWLVIFGLILWSLSEGYFPALYPGHRLIDYWVVGLAATLMFFASVLIHELCHAAVGNLKGEKIDRITLFIFGGLAHMGGEPRNAIDEIVIAGVGPLASLLLALLFWLVYQAASIVPAASLWTAVFRYLAAINLALALFNLLPGFPLDGGRLFRAMLWKRTGNLERATARAADWGAALAWGMMIFGAIEIFGGALVGGLWLIFIGLFLRSAAISEYQGTVLSHLLQNIRVRDIMTSDPIALGADIPIAEAVEKFFLKYGYGGFPVVAEGRAIGTLSLSEVRNCAPENRAATRVSDLMRPIDAAIEIAPQASAMDALRKMNAAQSGRLLVIDDGRLAGLITRTAVTRFMQMRAQLEAPPHAGRA